jgi:hypothetical protein
MKSWTPDASEHFEAWLGTVKRSVAADPTLNPDDIAQDLRAHVHAELEASPEPVTVGAVDQVLTSLGNPGQWGDSIRQPKEPTATAWFQRNVVDVVTEWQKKLAGDGGMPVLLLVLTLVAIPTFERIGFVLLAFAYFVARAQVTYAPGMLAGKKKWMIYLPLAIGSGMLAGLVLGFPLILQAGELRVLSAFDAMWALGCWWVIVGILAAREPKAVRGALKPFAETFDASHARLISLVGAALLIASSVFLLSR